MSDSPFDEYSRYYDLLYMDKDYISEANYIHSVLVKHGIDSGNLLEFGSGTGRHGRVLAKFGYRVHGIERSTQMASAAVQGEGFSCQQGDIAAEKIIHPCDAVLSLFHVMSYQITNQQVCAVFSNAALNVRRGGLFIFDFWYSPAVYAQGPSSRLKRVADGDLEIFRIAEPVMLSNENRVDIHYTILARTLAANVVKTVKEIHSMRHFSLPEIDMLANAHGFERVGAEEFGTGAAPSEGTWGICVTLRRTCS